MFRAGFLGRLSDATVERLAEDDAELDRAAVEFGFDRWIGNGADPDLVSALFAEWLVFDRATPVLNNMTGLAYFLDRNPLNLLSHDLAEYRDLTQFSAGFFEVVEVVRGERVVLEDMAGARVSVYDVNASLSTPPGKTIWTRIAPIGDVYHMVGSSGFAMPIVFGPGMKKAVREWGEHALDARAAAEWRWGRDGKEAPGDRPLPDLISADTAPALDAALKDAGMEAMLSSATVRRWTDARRFPLGFPLKAIFFLMPEDLDDPKRDRLMEAVTNHMNALPLRTLKGKSPSQAHAAQRVEDASYATDLFGYEDYAADHGRAFAFMRDGKYREAYQAFEDVIRRFLDEKVPAFISFRVYTNAGICCCMDPTGGMDGLGCELIRASLRLNPRYDFGLMEKKRWADPYEELARVPRKDRALAKMMRDIITRNGVRRYRRTPFRRYEEFLTEKCGVSLAYQTHTAPTVFTPGQGAAATHKMGRNEPCPCDSGKKYKKCHGRGD